MITYCIEPFSEARSDMEKLLDAHWRELGRDQDDPRFQLDPDWETYAALEAIGQVAMMVARSEGVMIGYIVGFVRRQLHYRKSTSFATDVYFLHKDHRKGLAGPKMFMEMEKAMRARGVDKLYGGCKVAPGLDRSKMYKFLGYELIEYTFAKVLD